MTPNEMELARKQAEASAKAAQARHILQMQETTAELLAASLALQKAVRFNLYLSGFALAFSLINLILVLAR